MSNRTSNRKIKQGVISAFKLSRHYVGTMWWENKMLCVDGINDIEYAISLKMPVISLTANQLKGDA